MASSFATASFLLVALCVIGSVAHVSAEESEPVAEEFVVTLEQSNFTDFVASHKFVVVEFYAPWCGHCKKLAPEYEKAASILSKEDPPLVLAKVDVNEEQNKGLASEYGVTGFPTIKILRYGGSVVQEYKGPREADGIVAYVKKQSGPASTELKSADEAAAFIGDKKIVIVGVFPEFSGEKFESFTTLAERLRSDYEFGHVADAKFLPRGESSVSGPVIRLFKPFDELVVDFQDFDVDSLVKLIEETSVPTVTTFNNDPDNHPFVVKFFNTEADKAMLFLDFNGEKFDAFKSAYHAVAEQNKGKDIGFLIGDVDASKGAFQFFGLKEDQVPLIVVQKNDGQKFLKSNLEPDHIASFVKEYKEGNVQPFKKSEPIPEVNNEPVKVVVADTLQDIVFNSGKNVLLEFYAPWCGHCKKLAPILDEVAAAFEDDTSVVIAKIDSTANDVPQDVFDVKGYPTLYFKSATGNLVQYDGDRTKEDMIEFIKKNSDKITEPKSVKEEL